LFLIDLIEAANLQSFFDMIRQSSDESTLMHARIAFRNLENMKWTVLCYFCPVHDQISWLDTSNSLVLLETEYDKNVMQGNQGPANVYHQSVEVLQFIINSKCLSENYKPKPEVCAAYFIPLNIALSQKLNLTLRPAADTTETAPPGPGLYLNLDYNTFFDFGYRELNEHVKLNIKVLSLEMYMVYFSYCYFNRNADSQKWSILAKPFDRMVWLCLGLTCIAYACVQNNVLVLFDTIGFLLCQPLQLKWKKWCLATIILLIIFTQGYLGVVTTDLTKPLPEKRFEQLADLLDGGRFKFLCPASHCDLLVSGWKAFIDIKLPKYQGKITWNHFKKAENVHITDMSIIITVAKHDGALFMPKQFYDLLSPFFVTQSLFKIQNASCSIVKEHVPEYPYRWGMALHFSSKAMAYFELIQSAGITKHWKNNESRLYLWHYLRENRLKLLRADIFRGNEPQVLGLNASILITFSLYGIMVFICFAVFGLENILGRICRASAFITQLSILIFIRIKFSKNIIIW